MTGNRLLLNNGSYISGHKMTKEKLFLKKDGSKVDKKFRKIIAKKTRLLLKNDLINDKNQALMA